jgi:hypothetical protein
MPFVPIHLLPLYDPKARDRFQDRWQDMKGHENAERVAKAISEHGREHFLDSECGDLIGGFLEHDRDLRGFQLFDKHISLVRADNFKGMISAMRSFITRQSKVRHLPAWLSISLVYITCVLGTADFISQVFTERISRR